MPKFRFLTALFGAQNRAASKRTVEPVRCRWRSTRSMLRHEWNAKVMQPTRSSCWEIQIPVRQKWHVDNCQNDVFNNKSFNKSGTRQVSPSAVTALDVVFYALSPPRSISVWIAIFFRTDAIVCEILTICRFENRFLAITLKLLIFGPLRCAHSNQRRIWTLENPRLDVCVSKKYSLSGKICFPGTPTKLPTALDSSGSPKNALQIRKSHFL